MINWLSSLKKSLSKSSSKISLGLDNIFNKRAIDDEVLDELEELLLSADLGYEAASRIVKNFASVKISQEVTSDDIKKLLADNIRELLRPCETKLNITQRPHVILMIGVNGAGKTTTIGKLAHKFKDKQTSLIAGDTFRAAAVEQLSIWGQRNNVKVHTAPIGGDAAGLCYDGLKQAIADGDELVFIDTAGRLQNKANLNDELKKIIRVIKKVIPDAPHHTLLCLDATTGQNAVEQVKIFKEVADVNGLIINKLDGTAKGGALVSIACTTPTPIYYIGTGEGMEDLSEFNSEEYAKSLVGL